ncbi:MAG: aspartate-semialdehyde dehydrogenase [Verrucomicrobia bacterium]|jgi:aspartate-semialdehyde dehydrogenase|nr:MAG: aspartate-semialdehyde dehydrogenase [Verrucomicrobiota bacterium]
MFLQKSSSLAKNVAIVGATGAVGEELLRVLERRHFPIKKLRLLASSRSAGRSLSFRGQSIPVEVLEKESFDEIDIAFFSAGGTISEKHVSDAVRAGAVVVDNSSAFRMDPSVPLVIPEINGADILTHQGIIANPNCSTLIALMALYPLHQQFGLSRVIASTYQAVSGIGTRGIEELENQVVALAHKKEVKPDVFPYQIAFNLLPHIDSFLDNGYTREEMKFQNESQRIMHLPNLKASVTCVRVPVYRAHSISIHAEFENPLSLAKAQDALIAAPGIDLIDDPSKGLYPMPLEVQGCDQCHVGRLRVDYTTPHGLSFWVCGDQLLKGAALNAVQIAELIPDRRDIGR